MSAPALTCGSTFSGVGGLDLAVQQLFPGVTTLWHSEINPDPARVLAHHWPNVPNLGDITKIHWETTPKVDILTGGFPCQDLSLAGARKGLTTGTRSGLWWHLRAAIDILRPRLVILENVPGILSAWGEPPSDECRAAAGEADRLARAIRTVDGRRKAALRKGQTDRARRKLAEKHRLLGLRRAAVGRRDRAERLIQRAIATVLGSLAEIGFDAEWGCFRASDVGAAHRRERWFLIAWPAGELPPVADPGDDGREGGAELDGPQVAAESGAQRGHVDRHFQPGPVLTLPTPTATPYGNNQSDSPNAAVRPSLDYLVRDPLTRLFPNPRASDGAGGNNPLTQPANDDIGTRVIRLMPTPRATDGPNGGPNQAGSKGDLMLPSAAPRWEDYLPALEQHANTVGRLWPDPTEPAPQGGRRINPAFSEWLMGYAAGWVTSPKIGISRSAQLTAIGNGVFPNQAAAAIRSLLARALADDGGAA